MIRYHIKNQILVLAFSFITLNLFSQTFTEQTGIVLPGLSNSSVAWGDYDNDGDMDILVAGLDASNYMAVKIFRNNGGNSFTDQTNIFSPAIPASYGYYKITSQWVDFDNDGLLDVLINGPSSTGGNILMIYRNEGNNTFTLKTSIEYATWEGNSVDCGDYDNDGDQDILLATSGTCKIYQNQGNFVFNEQYSIALDGLAMNTTKWFDYDNDGNLDIIITGQSGYYPTTEIYKNQGNNTFVLQTGISISGGYSGSTEWGDYNNDGFPDLLITGSYGISSVYKNNGNNTFSWQSGINLKGVSDGIGKWGDIDNDGDLDIIISGNYNSSYITKVYINNGNNTFTESTTIILDGVYQCAVDLADYDNDGDLDILISGNKGASKICKVYRNDSSVTNSIPVAPTGLASVSSGNDIILKWKPVTTDNTPAKSLSYNIMVGKTSGGIDIVSPNSSTTGFHRISGMGNAELDTTFKLRNLKKGVTYYWKVQAIDNCFKGGAFSSEATFTYSVSYQAYNLKPSVIGGKESTLTWTRGNGTNCIVFMKAGNSGTAVPSNGSTYNASSAFMSGNQIGTSGWYCIYKGTLTSVNVSGLNAKTDYIYQVIEFDGIPGSEIYNTQTSSTNPYSYKTGLFTEVKSAILLPVTSFTFNLEQSSFSYWIDIDNDNDLDLLLVGQSYSRLYRNDGSDVFTLLPVNFMQGYGAACGDYNNDGYIDVLISGNPNRLYKNNGNGTFTEQPLTSIPGTSYGSLKWSDYDNDGDLDITLTGESSTDGRITRIYKNVGSNTFVEQPLISLAGVNGIGGTVKWADYDNDGLLDFILTGFNNSATVVAKVYRNTGNNNFTEQTGIVIPTDISNYTASFEWGDFDSDGDLDLFMAAGDINSKIYVNNGNNTFTEKTGTSFSTSRMGAAAWGDFDNDGDLDIILSGETTSHSPFIKLYINNGDGTFTEDTSFSVSPVAFSSVSWGDYDNDGDLDLVISGNSTTSSIAKIYRNDNSVANVKPAAPTGIVSTVNKSDVTMKWKAVRTDNTPYKAMSYNIKVGTASGGINIVSPHSSATGYRRMITMGNGNIDTTFVLKNLPFGTYYWSVQAVDNSFAGGAFSSEGTFSVVPVQAKNLSAKILDNNSLSLKWERGNGDRCIVFCKQTSTGLASPVNNTDYIADNQYSLGTQIGTTGWYCVYNGRADSVNVTGLVYKTQYSFHVIEYMGAAGTEQYFTLVTDGNPGVFSTSLFEPQTGITLNYTNMSPVAWGDYDNDGFIDILIFGNPTRIYRNNGDNTFIEETGISLPTVYYGSAAWGDYDNDGDLDIIITGATVSYPLSSPVTKIFRNDGANVFTEQTLISLTAVYYSSVAWGDYDNDGNLDILLTGATGSDPNFNPVTKIYHNNGNGSFTAQTQINLTNVFLGSAVWGDYDNDGDLDIILNGALDYNYYYNTISKIYRNNGNNNFIEQTQISLPGFSFSSSAWGDFDNDGYLDFLMTRMGEMVIYRNLGNNQFQQFFTVGLSYQGACSAAWGDYDNDGYLDIILTNPGLETRIYRNTRGITVPGAASQWFNQQDDEAVKSAGYGFDSWVDYDNDGDLDFLLSYQGKPTMIYKNNMTMKSGLFKPNTAPVAPTGLTKEYSPSGVKLKWSPVINDETSYKAMTYNIRVGTKKDSTNICPSQSSSTGFRKIVSMGNAQLDTTFFLKNLSSRKYYWSVQAVDQGLKGGAWSAVDSFVVRNVQTFFSADTICQGLPTHFTDQSVAADGIASWKWDFKDGTTSTLQNPSHVFLTGGTYNVKLVIKSTGGVKDSLEKNTIVKLKPTTGFTALATCQGTPSTITNTTNNNGLSISSWYWNFGDGQNSTVQQPPSHGYLGSGNYTVLLKALANNGCTDSTSNIVTVASYPVSVITANTPLTFCKGDSVTLSVAKNTNYTYKWLLNGASLTNGDSSKYAAKLSGNYTVAVTNKTGNCKTTSDQAVVNAQNAPAAPLISVSGPITFCQGDSVILSITNTSGYTYQWKQNGGSVGTSQNSFVSKSVGSYSVTVTNSFGCSANSSNTVNVIVNPKPTVPTVSISGATSFCQGNSVDLSVINNSAYTYQWQNNGSNISGAITNVYTAASSGVYSLNIANSSGCVNKTENVTVNSLIAPSAPSISTSGALLFCQGDSVTLSVTTTTGNTYQWKLNGGAVGSNSNTFVAKNSGSYNLVVSNTNSCSASSSNSVNVVVNSLPAISAVSLSGPTTFCSGGSITLSIPSTSGYSYNWRNENGPILGANTNSYLANTSGKYQVDISNSSGCVVKTSQVTVVTKQMPIKPVITSDNYQAGKCMGEDPIRLNASQAVTGYNYQWYKNGIPISGATSSTYEDFLSQGDYTLEADLGGCKLQSDILNVYFENAPDKPLIYAEGPTVWYLACSNDSASQYKWYYNGTIIQGADKYIYVANKNLGKYAVSIANTKGCFTRSDVITIPTGATGIKDIDPFAGLKIYPNPATGLFTIEMDNQIFGELLINIIAQEGKEILKIKFEKTTVHFSSQIDLSGQPKGMYLINLLIDKYFVNRKVIVE